MTSDQATLQPIRMADSRSRLNIDEARDNDTGDYYLTVRRHTPPTQDQEHKEPLVIPLRMGLFGRRRLKILCLGYLSWHDRVEDAQHATDQINVARNMTDVITGLRVLTHLNRPEREEKLEAFYEKWKDDPLVTDKWLALQATAKRENVIEDVKRMMEHPAFNRRNSNRIRSLIGAFAMGNFEGVHRADGEEYRLLADFVIELDLINPQIASRLVQAMIRWRRFNEDRQGVLKQQLERVMYAETCSANTYEVVSRATG